MAVEIPYIASFATPVDIESLRYWCEGEFGRIETSFGSHESNYGELAAERMLWKGSWIPGTYLVNDVTYDGGWLMIANKETSDRPAPQPVGQPEYSIPDSPAWLTESDTATIYAGADYTFTESGWLNALRVWLPVVGNDYLHKVIVVFNPGNNPSSTVYDLSGTASGGWELVSVGSRIVTAGTVVRVGLETRNFSTTTPFTGDFTFGGRSQTLPPASQSWNSNSQHTLLRVSKTDLNSNDRTAALLNMVAGTTITFTLQGSPGISETYSVLQDPTDAGSHVLFSQVSRTASSGAFTLGDTTTMNAQSPVPQPAEYVELAGHWTGNQPTWATVQGFLALSGSGTVPVNDAFGVDIEFQQAAVSPDWDLMALSDDASGGGGGMGEWGEITGDIKNQQDLQDEFINREGDTWDQGVTQIFPNDPAATDSTDAEFAFINFFGVNALRIQAATANTPNGVGYLLLTDRQNEAFPFIVGSKYDGWRCRNQLFTDPDAILTLAEGDSRYLGGGSFVTVDTDQTITGLKTFDNQVVLEGGLTGGLIVNGSGAGFSIDAQAVILGRSGFNAFNAKVVAVAPGTNGTDAVNLDQLNGKADTSHTHDASQVNSGVFSTARIPNLEAEKITTGTLAWQRLPDLIDKQITIGGGVAGGLIVTGTGAGFSIDATGVILGRAGFNANNQRIVAVADGTSGTDAVNVNQLNGKANTSHTHSASQITSGTLAIARIPTGTTSSTVALGNHGHAGVYAPVSTTVTTNTTQTISGAKTFSNNMGVTGVLTVSSGANLQGGALMGGNRVQSVATPSVGFDAANKNYVDGSVSDIRAKTNITDQVDADRIYDLRVVSFEYDYDLPDKPCFREGRHYGVIAQEAEGVLPEAVYDSPFDDLSAFDYPMLTPLLLKTVQDQRKQLMAQESRISILEQQMRGMN